MIRNTLEKFAGKKLQDEDYKLVMEMATDDIRVNRVRNVVPKRTSIAEAVHIAIQCLITLTRCKEI